MKVEGLKMGWKVKILKEIISEVVPKEVVDLGTKIGHDMYEQQKLLVKIPDLKDVHIEEALRILKDELHLVPTKIVANPNIAYADESEFKVVLVEPRFGSKVKPGTPIKIYYLTQEIIDKSKVLLGSYIHTFKVPSVVGLNVYEAREDLERLGLKVTHKKDLPSSYYANKEDGQVTKLAYANGQNIGSKLRTGERVCVYYVDDAIISESKAMQYIKEKENQNMINKVSKVTHDISKGLSTGAVSTTKKLTQNLKERFSKKKSVIDEDLIDE